MQAFMYHIRKELFGLYPEAEIQSFTNLILSHITGFSRTEIILNKYTIFSVEQKQISDSFIEKLKIFTPIQYILGETEFFGMDFRVNESVLIPRPETEELVEWILSDQEKNSKIQILDIGTGSGCIALSLKNMLSQANVSAFDISEGALKLAKLNAQLNNLDVHFELIDILNKPILENKWDVIVSNPPYIPENEKNEILSNVLDFEPHLALFVPDNDPLIFYDQIAEFGKKHLHQGGKLFFEIHRSKANEVMEILVRKGFSEVEKRKDISKNDRMIKAILL